MSLFSTTPSQRQLGLGLVVLRLALGAVFIVHGGQKLFMLGPSGTGGMLVKMGIPAANLIGPVLSVVEPLAAIGVLLGLVTRLSGVAIAIDMLGAIVTFHIHNGFFVPIGVEFVMMNCAAGLTLAIVGAGPYSVDHVIEQRRGRA